jgi:hypothetical protein
MLSLAERARIEKDLVTLKKAYEGATDNDIWIGVDKCWPHSEKQ